MKKLLLVFALSLGISAHSQTIKGQKGFKLTDEERVQKHVTHIDKIVGLSPEQKVKVKDYATLKVNKTNDLREKYKPKQIQENKELFKKELIEVRKQYRENVKQILTPEQQEKLKNKSNEKKNSKIDKSSKILDEVKIDEVESIIEIED